MYIKRKLTNKAIVLGQCIILLRLIFIMPGNCKNSFLKIPKIGTTFLVEMVFGSEKCFSDHYLLLYFGCSECLAENDMNNSQMFVHLLFPLTDLRNSL